MHLVVDHVTELEEVSDTDRRRLVKALTRPPIVEVGLTIARQASLICPSVHIV